MAVIKWDFVNEIYKPNLCPSYYISKEYVLHW